MTNDNLLKIKCSIIWWNYFFKCFNHCLTTHEKVFEGFLYLTLQEKNLNFYFWKITLIFSSPKLIYRYKAISFSIKNISLFPPRAGQVDYKVDLEELISKNSQRNLIWKRNERRVLLLNTKSNMEKIAVL